LAGRALVIGKDEQERRETKQDHSAALNNAFDAVEGQLEKLADRTPTPSHTKNAGQSGMVVRLFLEQNYGCIEKTIRRSFISRATLLSAAICKNLKSE